MNGLSGTTWSSEDRMPYQGIGATLITSTSPEQELPQWWPAALSRILFLLELPENWDSYDAKKINQQIAYHAAQILLEITRPGIPEPSIVPTVRGNLQFEWHTRGIDLEFEVKSSVLISVSFEDTVTGNEWEKDLDYNLIPLKDVIRQLVSRD